jgi:glycosyltransferase involved in cell wall biosynthesis
MEFNYYTIIIGIICGAILFFKLPRLTKSSKKTEDNDLKISVIIPARNEEKNLPNILGDLENQTYSIHEIICVDDSSEDRTPEIIKKYNVKGITVSELPSNWKGKTWACQNGAKAAIGDILLFIDAKGTMYVTPLRSDYVDVLLGNHFTKHPEMIIPETIAESFMKKAGAIKFSHLLTTAIEFRKQTRINNIKPLSWDVSLNFINSNIIQTSPIIYKRKLYFCFNTTHSL